MVIKGSLKYLCLTSFSLLNSCYTNSVEVKQFDFKREILSNSSRISGQAYSYFRAYGFRFDINYKKFEEDNVDNSGCPTLTALRYLTGEKNNNNFDKDKCVKLNGENKNNRINIRFAFAPYESLRRVLLAQYEVYSPIYKGCKITKAIHAPSLTFRYFKDEYKIGVGAHLFVSGAPQVGHFNNCLKREWDTNSCFNFLGFHLEGSYPSYVNVYGYFRFPLWGTNVLLDPNDSNTTPVVITNESSNSSDSNTKKTNYSVARAISIKLGGLINIMQLLNYFDYYLPLINYFNPSFMADFKCLVLPQREGIFNKVTNSSINSALCGMKKGFVINPFHSFNIEFAWDSSNYMKVYNEDNNDIFIFALLKQIFFGKFVFGINLKYRSDIPVNDQATMFAYQHYGLYKPLGKRLDTIEYLDPNFCYYQIQGWVEQKGKPVEWNDNDEGVDDLIKGTNGTSGT